MKSVEIKKIVQDCWSRLNASRATQNSFAGRMFVTSGLEHGFSTWDSQTFTHQGFPPSLLQSTAHLLCVTATIQAADE